MGVFADRYGVRYVGATVLPTVMGIALDQYRSGDVVAGAFCSALWLSVRHRRRGHPSTA